MKEYSNKNSHKIMILSLSMALPFVHAQTITNNPVIPTEPLTLNSVFKLQNPTTINRLSATSVSYNFSGSTADSINYIQFCLASDTLCSSCYVPFAPMYVGTPLPYATTTSGGTNYTLSSTGIAYFLNLANEPTGTYYIGLSVQSTHLLCSSNAAYCQTNQDSSSAKLCIKADYTSGGGGSASLTRIDNGSAILSSSKKQEILVSQSAGSSKHVYQCSVNANDGTLSSCTNASGSTEPWSFNTFGIAAATASNNNQFFYLTGASTSYYKCTVGANGSLSSCNSNSIPNTQLTGIAFTSTNLTRFPYFSENIYADSTSQVIYLCSYNSNGTLNCSNGGITPSPSSGNLYNLGITTVNGSQYLYGLSQVVGIENNVLYCLINPSTGSLSGCASTNGGASFNSLTGITFTYPIHGTQQFTYLADGQNVYYCSLNGDGSFNTCTSTPTTPPSWNSPTGITTAIVNGNQYAYVATGNGSEPNNMYVCSVSNDGSLSNCNSTPTSPPSNWSPYQAISIYY